MAFVDKFIEKTIFGEFENRLKKLEEFKQQTLSDLESKRIEILELFEESRRNLQKAEEAMSTGNDALITSIQANENSALANSNATLSLNKAEKSFQMSTQLNEISTNAFDNAKLAYDNNLQTIVGLKQSFDSLKQSFDESYTLLTSDTDEIKMKISDVINQFGTIGKHFIVLKNNTLRTGKAIKYTSDYLKLCVNNILNAASYIRQLDLINAYNELKSFSTNLQYTAKALDSASLYYDAASGDMNNLTSDFNTLASPKIINVGNTLKILVEHLQLSFEKMKNSLVDFILPT